MAQPCECIADSRSGLAADLAALGLAPGSLVLVHCSLRRIGLASRGPAAVFTALSDVLGPRATIVVPTFTTDNSTTTRRYLLRTEGMTMEQQAAEEAKIPGFDRATTPSHRMGALAEYVRCFPGAVRSDHPQTSFAAVGPAAVNVTEGHELKSHLGERSPLAKLYAANAAVLGIGTGFDACTCFHLAEHRLPWSAPQQPYRTFVLVNGERIRRDFRAAVAEDIDFGRLGEAMAQDLPSVVHRGRVGGADAYTFSLRAAVDYAVQWMTRERRTANPGCRRPV